MPGFCWWMEQKGNFRFCTEVKEGIKGPERLRGVEAGALESVPWGGCRSWRAVAWTWRWSDFGECEPLGL